MAKSRGDGAALASCVAWKTLLAHGLVLFFTGACETSQFNMLPGNCWGNTAHTPGGAVCLQCSTSPIQTLEPWTHWGLPDLHGLFGRLLGAVEIPNQSVHEGIEVREEEEVRSWCRWIREDFSSHPFQWLRLELASPVPT